jgi:hypothetical protein
VNSQTDVFIAPKRMFYYVDHKRRRVWSNLQKLTAFEADRIDADYFRDLLSMGYDRTEPPLHEH